MDLKKLLENKPKLKENLAMYILETGIFNDLLKTNRNSAQQIVLMKLEDRVYSMNENEIIEYFETNKIFYASINPVFFSSGVSFECSILNKKGELHYEIVENFENRKFAINAVASKLIELSNWTKRKIICVVQRLTALSTDNVQN